VLVTLDKPRDRRVIRNLIRADHPVGDVLAAVALDPSRRALLAREREQNQRDQVDSTGCRNA
jgi:hypothetical protein